MYTALPPPYRMIGILFNMHAIFFCRMGMV
jgi:hypothetical protein